ncbi:MAG: endonuclease/exonuclease/phosphatase family protein [Chloroflexi bacterium]|nr:endonuclease/exonuclease/phosphatase family protein [Chloroflexota bacterium]
MFAQKNNRKLQTRRLAILCTSILLTMVVLQACGTPKVPEGARIIEDTPTRLIPTKTPYVTPTIPSSDFLTATASALQVHEGAVRFMNYNVNQGGLDKLPQITSILQAYNADVLAIEETNGWQLDDFAIAKQVAGDLGMEYVFCSSGSATLDKNGNTYDMVLMSKLEIKSSETFADVQNCLIRAEVATPDGSTVQVFATQVNPNFDDVGCLNVENLVKAAQPFTAGAAILLGDMTMPPPNILLGYPESQILCPPLLEAAGWSFLTDVGQVDHVWATEAMLAKESYVLPSPNKEPLVAKSVLRNTSDHNPLAVDFFFP